ncbi:hypothetical protein [Streptomyces sp. NPDC048527]|uniref:hypothetical protein n=1 Tax=Streptomyces sp. NPDC048527 TaxID=3365568 RepID=UPI0037185833
MTDSGEPDEGEILPELCEPVWLENAGVGIAFVVSLAVQAAIMLAIAADSLTLPHLHARLGETGVAVDV